MLKKPELQQQELELVSIESLVPEKHLLRKVDGAVDFGFIRERVKHLYCEDNGRPALDPVVLFKLLLLGYLYGVRSERQLMREVEVNVAYRWFLGLKLRDKVPDASTLSQNRRRREHDLPGDLRPDRVAGGEQGPGLGGGVVHRFDAPEGQRQQEQVRSGAGSSEAPAVPCRPRCSSERGPGGARQGTLEGQAWRAWERTGIAHHQGEPHRQGLRLHGAGWQAKGV